MIQKIFKGAFNVHVNIAWVVSQISTFVYVGWVGGQSNVYINIFVGRKFQFGPQEPSLSKLEDNLRNMCLFAP